MSQLIPPYPFILNKLNEGKVIPFLGAGASLGGRVVGEIWKKGIMKFLPLGGELAGYLADTTQFPADEALDLTKVAQYYNVVGGREALNEELHGIFNCDYPLTPLHKFLASLTTPLLIVTTNYDDLIERALEEENSQLGVNARPYDVVIHTTDVNSGDLLLWWPHGATEPIKVAPNKLDVDLNERTVVYKMHGAVDRKQPERDSYVITEDDYIDFLARMTKNKAVPAIFAEFFQRRHFLFLGYGLNDWNLRVVLNRIEKDLRRPKGITSWAIQHRTRVLERRFWQERGVEVYDLLLEDFVGELQQRRERQKES
ncbi:MAG TPA: SIR2 family protein [Pyrinomonadaceae bacterium]|nr:SIR2 family protein [Pyrinomonadaceae bacterium]